MNVFSNIETPKKFLNDHCLSSKVLEVFVVLVSHSPSFEHFPGKKCSEEGLDFDRSGLFLEEFFSFDEHAENGLDFECSCIVPFPVFFCLICAEVVLLG